jgi:hypothetical protein
MQKSWDGYITALGGQKTPASTIDTGIPFPTSGGPRSGFFEFHPKPDVQKKYDAMNPAWEGIQASNAHLSDFKPEFMPLDQNGFSSR